MGISTFCCMYSNLHNFWSPTVMYISRLVGKMLTNICFSSNSSKIFNQLKFSKALQAKRWHIAQILNGIEHHVEKLKALTQNVMDGQKPGLITQSSSCKLDEAQRIGLQLQLMPWTGYDSKCYIGIQIRMSCILI